MTVLVTCGYQETWCEFVQTRLRQMGVEDALTAQRSELSPQDLTHKMSAAYKLSVGKPSSLKQSSPGKAWQITAADLFVANAEQDSWGWADRRNIFFLNFWREFDPMCKFVLVYGSPAQSLACSLNEHDDLADDAMTTLDEWTRYHEEMLRFYLKHSEQCLLIHIDMFEDSAKDVTTKLIERFEMSARRVNEVQELDKTALLQLITGNMLSDRQQDQSLMDGLESAADLPANADATAHALSHQALQEFLDARNNTENEDEAATAEEVSMKTAENELLEKQLHQVQEELQLYFRKYQDLKSKPPATISKPSSPASAPAPEAGPITNAELIIDMRSFINGSGWHSAEQQGRWAGLETTSTLKLAPLQSASYRLELNIVDAMSLDIAKGMRVQFDGHALPTSFKILSNVGGHLAPLRRLKATLQKVEKPYPIRLSAIISAQMIQANSNGHTLTLISPETMSPAQGGDLDTRELSVCVDTLSIRKVI